VIHTGPTNLRGIAAMCFAMAVFMVSDTAVKLASQSLSVGQVVLLRGLFSCAILAAVIALTGAWRDLRHVARPLVLTRCLLEGLTAITFIGALAVLPIATVTAVFLTAPLMITVAAAVLLGETVRWRRWLAAILGFVGMLIVVRPTTDGLNAGVALVLTSTVLCVARDLITRKLPPDVPTGAVAAGTIIVSTLVGGALTMLQPWRPVEAPTLVPLAVAAVAVTAGNYAIIVAFREGEVSVVSPFRYTLMFWGVIAGLLVFGHWPDPMTWVGVSLIIGAGVYTLWREARVAAGKA
jgi:drug/metabolite transporter (DMT)-like permease